MKHQHKLLVISLLALGLLAGCATDGKRAASSGPSADGRTNSTPQGTNSGSSYALKNVFTHPRAVVKIPFEGEQIEVKVELAGWGESKRALAGISALQVPDLDSAITEFAAAMAEKPKKKAYPFALAVAEEAKGDYANARIHYIAANKLNGGEGMFDALAGLKRLAARGK